MSSRPLMPSSFALLPLALAAASCLAQTDEAPKALPTVVVKAKAFKAEDSASAATRLDLSLLETPQSASIVSLQQMRDFGLDDVNKLLDMVTGVNVERVETDRTYFSARGFDVTNFQMDGLGLPFTNGAQWGTLDMAAYERVEVLRGATGLMAATGNPSATINFVRKRADSKEFSASAALTVGSWNQRRVEADLGGALNADGSLRGRLALADEDRDSYLDRYGKRRSLVHGVLSWDLDRNTTLTAGLSAQRGKARSPMWGALPLTYSDGTPTNYDSSASTAADWAWWNNNDTQGFVELQRDLGNEWQLKTTLSHRLQTSRSELFYVFGSPDKSTGLGLYGYPSLFKGDYRESLADVYASGPFALGGRRHQLMFGASTARQEAQEYSGYMSGSYTALPAITDLGSWDGSFAKPSFDASSNGSDFSSRRHSAYVATHLNLSEELKLVAGLVASKVSSSGQNYGVSHAYKDHAVKPYLGATYQFDKRFSAYASYAEVFNPQTETDINNQVLKPIEGKNLEAGLKAAWMDGKLQGTLALFRTQQQNTAEAAGTRSDFSTYYQGVDATSQGYELDLAGELQPGWSVGGGYTQLRLTQDSNGQDARRYVPRRTFKLHSSYQLLPALKLGAALRWQSEISSSDGTARQGAYALLDLMASYRFDKSWSATLNIGNATDRKYLNSLYWTQAYYGAPRNASLRLDWRY